ncbi:zinc finger and BTB domain-containing protein 21 isoform X1 [Rhineura floridana]|uniref:zinc finger and BTB domain-containing protein 21 isoform X1 n=1 Tax=Rhineura floridana TaxID=261503 RepID=UPI002AC815F1|nr:zinc finger and BTB domain-containing protein 21 isoform X1 [Rhineura floridana]XP_061483561.1 zinc finger and BTB domain-containing protein 21 isoform X1 [Rhineura floridana]XP_061483562.1 zinc finger and BTB domain-containing protein 21 isoform X1 [Rhineura floridana]XP_061483563.1 zinc finger and BTB domain-containing protein 21 isoform X1 [Rhineura floridana]XP_061483564.1 zinc finger and BTB domain-containing protein 21 isoform X1 [Rhineura floridana]XP_061483565.1 zinc finger and BTB 
MEGLLHYINPAHAISLLSALNEERLKGQLCDVVLIVGDQKFRAHKNVLAASSEYFQTLFTKKENESQSVFQLDFCEPDTFDNVLNYIYSSSLFVEKSSLAGVQEVGYSLGISFLTNIVSKSPHVPLPACPIKKILFQEEDESCSQKRSVIVCQSKSEAQGENVGQTPHDISHSSKPLSSVAVKTKWPQVTQSTEFLHSLSLNERRWLKDSSLRYSKSHEPSAAADDQSRTKRNAVLSQKMAADKEVGADEPGGSDQFLRGKAAEVPLKRPCPPVLSLCSSSESTFLLKETGKGAGPGEDRNLLYYSKLGLVIPSRVSGPENQSIDRSGPLVKSLLRRSLSMDSQVPVYSPSVDFKLSQGSSVVNNTQGRMLNVISQKSSMKESSEKAAPDDKIQVMHPHRLRSFSASQSVDREVASPLREMRIKTEPSSPLSDPSEIIRITVGDASSANKNNPFKMEDDHRDLSRLPAKRRFQADRRLPLKKIKVDEHASPEPGDSFEENSNPTPLDADFPDSGISKDEYGELEETKPNKKFKCKHCLKIFRSTAGLHRHVNMYHNPEKPYSCDICHKRFHTNFKVWTHCQTQHGIVKNPSPASSSHAILDEKFQRKLIDIVREREIKKALIVKLRRGKQGFQGQTGSQAQQVIKRNLRSRTRGAYICTYCGKAYRFLSQFKQHIKMHPGEKPVGGNKALKPKEDTRIESPVENKKVYQCHLCNAKFSSLIEQGNHERLCRNATVCPYCSLRFSSLDLKHDHEITCEYKKLTCLECMRTFKSSFSIWRHQVEVHNQNTMAPTENLSLPVLEHNGEVSSASRLHSQLEPNKMNNFVAAKEDGVFSDSSEQINFDSEDSSCLPEDLSVSKQFKIHIKEEPADDVEEEVSEGNQEPKETVANKDSGLWPCEKCGKIFTVHKQLERHQELLCSVKPFICHVCNKAFRTNFRLWSHFQSHMAQATEEPVRREPDMCAPANSPSPPPLPPPPPLPKIQPLGPDSPTGLSETPSATEKLFVPQESDTLFYHAPPLSAITFKRQYMCKLCHRTFKTAFSLWSHEQTHN